MSQPQFLNGRYVFVTPEGATLEWDADSSSWKPPQEDKQHHQDTQHAPQQQQEVSTNSDAPVAPPNAKTMPQLVDGRYTYEATDGVRYEFDEARRAWFPTFQDSLFLSQQAAYGELDAVPATMEHQDRKRQAEKDKVEEKKRKKAEGGNPSVIYVSGLPPDATLEEMQEFFAKCGIIKQEFSTGKPLIKLYENDKGELKGDGWVSYLKPESVQLAIELLDGVPFRMEEKNRLISVSVANFDQKKKSTTTTTDDPKKKPPPKKKLDKKTKRQMMQMNKKLEWFEEGESKSKNDRIVVIKHMFTLEELNQDAGLLIDLKEDLRDQCEKLGEITNITIYDGDSEGVVSIKFKDPESALACIELMNGRWYAQRQLEAHLHDGTRYAKRQRETDEEMEDRLKKYEQWLEKHPTTTANSAATAVTPPPTDSDSSDA